MPNGLKPVLWRDGTVTSYWRVPNIIIDVDTQPVGATHDLL